MNYKWKIFFMMSIFLVFFGYTTLKADGTRVRKWITLSQVIKSSPYIFIASIKGIDHKYGSRMAYGKMRRYVQKYRFKVKIQKVIKGEKILQALIDYTDGVVSIERSGTSIPGRWVLIAEKYRESLYIGNAKVGQTFIVYARSISENKIHFRYCDKLSKKKVVEALLKN